MKLYHGLLIIVFLWLNSCKHVAYGNYVKKLSLSFGQSGGFSGASNEYLLQGNGKLYHIREFSHDTMYVKTLRNEDIKEIFSKVESRDIKNISLDSPGNLNQFIRLFKQGEPIQAWQWAEGMEIPADLKDLHLLLEKYRQE